MKKTIVSAILIVFTISLNAQDIKTAKKSFEKKDFIQAKNQIDSYLSSNANNAEGLFLKAKIYEEIAAKDSVSNTTLDEGRIAFEAFKKGMENSKDNKEITLEMFKDRNFYKPLLNLYTDFYKSGLRNFNLGIASKKTSDFQNAVDAFIMANTVGKFATTNKLASLGIIDTALVLNIGQAAIYAENNDAALNNFKALADANIIGTKESNQGYQLPYEWLAQYYRDKKDDTNFNKYVDLGKKYFPTDRFFDLVTIDYYRNKKDYSNLFKKYDDLLNKYPDSTNYNLSFASEAFGYIYASDEGTKIENKEELLKLINSRLDKTLKNDPNNVKANWLMGQYFYNMGIETRQAANVLRAPKVAGDIKKKADLNVTAKQYFNSAIPYLDKAISGYEMGTKKTDKSNYKSVVNLASQNFEQLQQPDKVKLYQQKYDSADSKFVK